MRQSRASTMKDSGCEAGPWARCAGRLPQWTMIVASCRVGVASLPASRVGAKKYDGPVMEGHAAEPVHCGGAQLGLVSLGDGCGNAVARGAVGAGVALRRGPCGGSRQEDAKADHRARNQHEGHNDLDVPRRRAAAQSSEQMAVFMSTNDCHRKRAMCRSECNLLWVRGLSDLRGGGHGLSGDRRRAGMVLCARIIDRQTTRSRTGDVARQALTQPCIDQCCCDALHYGTPLGKKLALETRPSTSGKLWHKTAPSCWARRLRISRTHHAEGATNRAGTRSLYVAWVRHT